MGSGHRSRPVGPGQRSYTAQMLNSQQLTGLLAEPARRRVIASLILRSDDIDGIARSTGLDTRDIIEALDRIERSGLAIQGSDGTWVVLEESFALAARPEPSTPSTSQHVDQPLEHQGVLDHAIVDGKIVHWPTKRAKRRIVLEYLAQAFEPGRRYSEREVNAMLRPFHDDVAMLRRWLFDESFLDRADGLYWRTGGRVE